MKKSKNKKEKQESSAEIGAPLPSSWGCCHSAQSWYYEKKTGKYGCEDCDDEKNFDTPKVNPTIFD